MIVERICQEGQICSICVASICSLVRGPSQQVVGIQRTIWWFMLLLPSTTTQAGLSVQISGLSSAMVECICRDGHICVVGIASFEWLFRGPAQPVEQICVGALFHPDMGSCAVSYLFQIAVFKAETQVCFLFLFPSLIWGFSCCGIYWFESFLKPAKLQFGFWSNLDNVSLYFVG